MLNKKNKTNDLNEKIDKLDTIIGEGSSFEGNIKAEGIVRIDGILKGDLETKGDVYIGENARVEGNIKGRNLFVSGSIQGNVDVAQRLELNSIARLYGSITVGNLIIEQGAVFKGDCMTKSSEEDTDSAVVHNTAVNV